MGARKFALINVGLLRSRKLAKCNHKEKWAYLCAHFTPQGNFLGLFRYPTVLWQVEAGLTENELKVAITKLQKVGLIDFDADEEIVRIVGFHSQKPPENASQVIALVRDLLEFEVDSLASERMLLATSAEISVAAVKRAQSWKPDSSDWPKLRDALGQHMRRFHLDYAEKFLNLVCDEMGNNGEAVKGELSSLLPALSLLKQAQCRQGADTVTAYEDVNETKMKTQKKTNTNTNTGQFPNFGSDPNRGLAEKKSGGSLYSMPREATKQSALVKGSRG